MLQSFYFYTLSYTDNGSVFVDYDSGNEFKIDHFSLRLASEKKTPSGEVPSLYVICVLRTCQLLKESRDWRDWAESSFAFMPSSMLEDLLASMLTIFPGQLGVAQVRPIVLSPKLHRLDLFHARFAVELGYLFQCMFYRRLNLRSISVSLQHQSFDCNFRYRMLKLMLERCRLLEDLHSSIHIDVDVLRNCENLRCLRLHYDATYSFINAFKYCPDLDKLPSLQSLRVFSVCNGSNPAATLKFVSLVLKKFPMLTSVGMLESSEALAELLQGAKKGRSLGFQLRKCFWGVTEIERYARHHGALCKLRASYTKRIKAAVFCCPLVEELVMEVYHSDSIQFLSQLSHLTFLSVHFPHPDQDDLPAFLSLLSKIGSQLKHLSVSGLKGLPTDFLWHTCPQLESLRLDAESATAPSGVVRDFRVRHLTVIRGEPAILEFLLSSCPHLRELFLVKCESLGDSLLHTVLRSNPMSELRVALLGDCCLSQEGKGMFVQKAKSLETFHVHSKLLGEESLTCNSAHNGCQALFAKEFFNVKTHGCCF
ncbi:uncharacterized protein CDAR_493511 [Caerostris darwini]|uniref:Uncharacterized protein n=1 Tax=Caerostris darwini TaxID=1538125 RepID=A0AAV4VVQ3_9ARAC|nr:uncharacterized protein CDAR_493511 [Caerostris darwini]